MSSETSKRGRKGNFTGLKHAFLTLLASEFVIWRAEGRAGAFYDEVVRNFFNKYGYTTQGPFNINPAEDPEELEVDGVDDAKSGCRTQAEADMHKKRFDELRLVSLHSYHGYCIETHFLR